MHYKQIIFEHHKLGKEEIIVCCEGFASLLGIRLQELWCLTQIYHDGFSPRGNRECHNNKLRSKSDVIIEETYNHNSNFCIAFSITLRGKTVILKAWFKCYGNTVSSEALPWNVLAYTK